MTQAEGDLLAEIEVRATRVGVMWRDEGARTAAGGARRTAADYLIGSVVLGGPWTETSGGVAA